MAKPPHQLYRAQMALAQIEWMGGDDEAQRRRFFAGKHDGGDDAPRVHVHVGLVDPLARPDSVGVGSDRPPAPRRVGNDAVDSSRSDGDISGAPVPFKEEKRLTAI